MIYGWMISTKGARNIKIFANANRRRVLDFAMPWDGRGSLRGGIVIDVVPASFAEENTAVCLQMAN
jgi:hypothetical protein